MCGAVSSVPQSFAPYKSDEPSWWGAEHDARRPGLYETRIRHQVNKFTNFLTAGVRVGYNKTGAGKLESSEMLFENCIFDK